MQEKPAPTGLVRKDIIVKNGWKVALHRDCEGRTFPIIEGTVGERREIGLVF